VSPMKAEVGSSEKWEVVKNVIEGKIIIIEH